MESIQKRLACTPGSICAKLFDGVTYRVPFCGFRMPLLLLLAAVVLVAVLVSPGAGLGVLAGIGVIVALSWRASRNGGTTQTTTSSYRPFGKSRMKTIRDLPPQPRAGG